MESNLERMGWLQSLKKMTLNIYILFGFMEYIYYIYLVDATYTHTTGFMASYCNVRY